MSDDPEFDEERYDPTDSGESEELTRKTAREIIEYIVAHPNLTKVKITVIKCQIGKKNHFRNTISDSILLRYVLPEERELVGPYLRRRFTRTISGVTIVAVMTKPYECPGHCIYCPGPSSQPGKKAAQSYTGKEPAAMRSIMYNYDSYEQTFHQLNDQACIGHEVDKIELIVMGGTILYTPIEYQDSFIKGCFDAVINFREPEYNFHQRTPDLETAKQLLESASTRLTGVTFETRPDYCKEIHVDRILSMGGTRVEIGLQTTRDDVLEYVCRGHTIQQSIEALRIAKDAGLKITAHMMPNLPLMTPDEDIEVFRELFRNPDFRPDMLKIYPTLVVEGTRLYDLYQAGEYHPYPQEDVVKVIATVKSEIPEYVRIQRIQRDIPAYLIVDGVKNSNLRQLVQKELRLRGTKCNCIRCREEGFNTYFRGVQKEKFDPNKVQLYTIEYEASQGTEFFISFEDKEVGTLIGYCRLRICRGMLIDPKSLGKMRSLFEN